MRYKSTWLSHVCHMWDRNSAWIRTQLYVYSKVVWHIILVAPYHLQMYHRMGHLDALTELLCTGPHMYSSVSGSTDIWWLMRRWTTIHWLWWLICGEVYAVGWCIHDLYVAKTSTPCTLHSNLDSEHLVPSQPMLRKTMSGKLLYYNVPLKRDRRPWKVDSEQLHTHTNLAH